MRKLICFVIRTASLSTALIVLGELYKIGMAGYIVVCLSCLMWTIADALEGTE